MNEQRIQNPSLKIGSNQVVGYVHIESEEISNLEEKSARDGLKENIAYERLKFLTCSVISELEKKRFIYRRKVDLLNSGRKIDKELNGLYDYSALKRSVSDSLKKAGLSDDVIEEIDDIISKEQQEKNEIVEEIKSAVAVYQGQATLGKIINIILHEGRRPLNYFKNQAPNLEFYGNYFKKTNNIEAVDKIIQLTKGIEDNSDIFVNLFGRLDPLAAKKRETKSIFSLKEVLEGIVSVFENEIKLKNIKIDIICLQKIKFEGWKQDFYTIFANLIDNSIFWISEKQCKTRIIEIKVESMQNGKWQIDYKDSGPGIEPQLLESGVIFEPQFTTKPNGTGLGLSIAGEAAQRNELELVALQNNSGAHFRLRLE